MTDINPELLTILMLGGLLIGVLTGFSFGIVIGAVALLVGLTVWEGAISRVLYDRAFGIMTSYVLLAIPLFIFMGEILERSGITERMFDALYLWLGGLRGGLGISTVIIGTIIAACVGTISASVTMLTLVALPAMVKRGYDRSLASGAICASGCLGILIPPSIMLVVYGPMANLSVGKLFMAAFIPGFTLAALYCLYIGVRCLIEPTIGPGAPREETSAVSFSTKTGKLATSLMPPTLLVLAVLGTIFFGIAPPTEAAGVGAFAATLLTIAYRRFSWRVLIDVAMTTFKLSGVILLIGSMSFFFTGVFIGGGGGDVVKEFILSVPGGLWSVFGIMMLLVFLLGFFIDWIGIVFITVPIITPIGVAAGFDPLWFAMMVCLNLQTSFLTPPFCMAVYLLKGSAAPELGVTTTHIIRGVMPFVVLILVGLALFIAFPELILWLPSKMIK